MYTKLMYQSKQIHDSVVPQGIVRVTITYYNPFNTLPCKPIDLLHKCIDGNTSWFLYWILYRCQHYLKSTGLSPSFHHAENTSNSNIPSRSAPMAFLMVRCPMATARSLIGPSTYRSTTRKLLLLDVSVMWVLREQKEGSRSTYLCWEQLEE